MLSVSEIFGPTIQGEGKSQGQAVVFLRLGLCNLDCSWCDTPFTWDWTGKNGVRYDKAQEVSRVLISEVVQQLDALTTYPARLVISGGEPLVQQRGLVKLVEQWSPRPVEIETNGTLIPDDRLRFVQLNCSPKLSNSGIEYDRRINPEALQAIAAMDSTFKFVISSAEDLDEVQQLQESVLQVPPDRIYLMPEGTTREVIIDRLERFLFDAAATTGWNISPRLHALVWGNKRGI